MSKKIKSLLGIRNTIGEGTFGKIVTPNYKCIDFKKKSKMYVSKLIKNDTIWSDIPLIIKNNELEMLKKIKKIDINKYFITHKSMCKSTKKNYYYNIIFEKYGTSLDNIKDLKLTKKELKENILYLIKSLKFLHKNNITHRDINLRNILYKKGDKMKFADFGISMTKEKLKKLMFQKYKTVDDFFNSYYLLFPAYFTDHLYYEKYKPLYYKIAGEYYDEKIKDGDINKINELLKKGRKTLLKDLGFTWNFYKKEDTIDLKITIEVLYEKYFGYDIKELSNAQDDEFTLTQIEKIIKKK